LVPIERDRGVDVIDDVADTDAGHRGSSDLLCVERSVPFIDEVHETTGSRNAKLTTPFTVDDRAIRWKACVVQALLDVLERLVGDEVELDPDPPRAVVRDSLIVQAELASVGFQLDPMAGSCPGRRAEPERLIEADRLVDVR